MIFALPAGLVGETDFIFLGVVGGIETPICYPLLMPQQDYLFG